MPWASSSPVQKLLLWFTVQSELSLFTAFRLLLLCTLSRVCGLLTVGCLLWQEFTGLSQEQHLLLTLPFLLPLLSLAFK